jgi:hypothetical protein
MRGNPITDANQRERLRLKRMKNSQTEALVKTSENESRVTA